LVRRAKEQGLPVTAEVAPHHFTLTDEAVATYDTNAKMKPPLRGADDVAAVIAGLRDGVIDAIATDHAPHHRDEKNVEFEAAANGIVGLETAVPLAESVGGQVVPFAGLEASVTQADIVICSTSADRYLLTRPQIQGIMSARRQRPLFLIDLSVPRNLDPRIGQLENVYLYDIDDLEGIASSNLQMRLSEMEACSEIVEREMNGFLNRLNGNGSAHSPAARA
jgi:hypothetical protein